MCDGREGGWRNLCRREEEGRITVMERKGRGEEGRLCRRKDKDYIEGKKQ